MATTTFTKLISLVAYDATLTERPDDFYLRAKTMPDTIDLHAVARETALRLGGKNEDEVYTLLNAAESVKCDALSSGYIVSTPTALMQPCASGTVLKADLSKAPDRTKVKVYATLSGTRDRRHALLLPQTITAGQPLLRLTIGGQTYRLDATARNGAFEAGKSYTLNVTVSNAEITATVSINPWLTGGDSEGDAGMEI